MHIAERFHGGMSGFAAAAQGCRSRARSRAPLNGATRPRAGRGRECRRRPAQSGNHRHADRPAPERYGPHAGLGHRVAGRSALPRTTPLKTRGTGPRAGSCARPRPHQETTSVLASSFCRARLPVIGETRVGTAQERRAERCAHPFQPRKTHRPACQPITVDAQRALPTVGRPTIRGARTGPRLRTARPRADNARSPPASWPAAPCRCGCDGWRRRPDRPARTSPATGRPARP